MINVHMDKTCNHCEKEHLPCAMFLTDYKTFETISVYLCAHCLSNGLSAVVQAQAQEYRNGSRQAAK
jgi:hypothetical protein